METSGIKPELITSVLDRKYRNASPFRTLWTLYEGQRTNLTLSIVLYIIKHSPVWAMPIITANIINAALLAVDGSKLGDALKVQSAYSSLWINGLLLAVMILQNVPMHTLHAYFMSLAIRSMQLLLRAALVTRLQQLSMRFHADIQTGKLQSKVLRDVDAVENLSKQLINNIISGFLAVGVALTVTLLRKTTVAMFFVLTIPLAILIMHLFRNRMKSRNTAFRKEVESMSSQVSEMIEMIPVTRAHASEQIELTRVYKQLLKIRHAGQDLDVTNELFACCTWATFQTFQLFCLLFVCWMAFQGEIPVGDVVMYQGFFAMIIGAVSGILSVYPQITTGVESIRSLGEVLECPDLEQNEGKQAINSVQGNITFDAVTFQYPEANRPAVEKFSLAIKAGECVAFVGESGSGKSTLMNLTIGFRRPTQGRILIDGLDMATLNLRTYRKYLAVVSQQTVLFSGTIRENIAYGLEGISDQRVRDVLEMANAWGFVTKLPQGIHTPVGTHGGKLSGGQRQRLAIARALIRDPRVLILDEATSALDVVSERLVQEAIGRLVKGRTTLVVAHRLSTIRNADRIVVMSQGQIIEMGTHAELTSRDGPFMQLKSLQV